MPRLRDRVTGSEVVVPDEKVAGLTARGFDPVKDDSAKKKTAAKKATSSKSEK
jgi:hypothetical protein